MDQIIHPLIAVHLEYQANRTATTTGITTIITTSEALRSIGRLSVWATTTIVATSDA